MNEDKIGDLRSRKWQITINNPDIKGYTHDKIIEICNESKNLIYMCMSDEQGQTFHTHIYLHFASAVRFSTIDKRFHGGHFEIAKGTAVQNREYVFKEGKWSGSDKEETNIKDSHYELGEIPLERQGHRSDLDDLYDMIKAGMSNFEIISQNPSYILQMDKIDGVRQMLLKETYKKIYRSVDVTYIYGPSRTGKSKYVVDLYGYENIYRVCDYKHPFDDYEGQDIVVFEEFRSSLNLEVILKYLDGHPCFLSCRYGNKIACFTKVYIVTNIPLQKQYAHEQRHEWESYVAFMKRINRVLEFTDNGIVEKPVKYDEWRPCHHHPFKLVK